MHHDGLDTLKVPCESSCRVVHEVLKRELNVSCGNRHAIVPSDTFDKRELPHCQVSAWSYGLCEPRLRFAIEVELHQSVVLEHHQIPPWESTHVRVWVQCGFAARYGCSYHYRLRGGCDCCCRCCRVGCSLGACRGFRALSCLGLSSAASGSYQGQGTEQHRYSLSVVFHVRESSSSISVIDLLGSCIL